MGEYYGREPYKKPYGKDIRALSLKNARRAYEIADHYRSKGVHVILGGLHVTAMPDEAALHADTIVLEPGGSVE